MSRPDPHYACDGCHQSFDRRLRSRVENGPMLHDDVWERARPVRPERLGSVGRDALAYGGHRYAIELGSVSFGSSEPKAAIPFVVEAWAQPASEVGMRSIKRPSGAALAKGIADLFRRSPEREWRAHIDAIVSKLIKPATK